MGKYKDDDHKVKLIEAALGTDEQAAPIARDSIVSEKIFDARELRLIDDLCEKGHTPADMLLKILEVGIYTEEEIAEEAERELAELAAEGGE